MTDPVPISQVLLFFDLCSISSFPLSRWSHTGYLRNDFRSQHSATFSLPETFKATSTFQTYHHIKNFHLNFCPRKGDEPLLKTVTVSFRKVKSLTVPDTVPSLNGSTINCYMIMVMVMIMTATPHNYKTRLVETQDRIIYLLLEPSFDTLLE